MPKIVKKQEVLCFEGISISDFLDKKFLEKIREQNLEIDPISLVFMVENKKDKEISPIVLAHESKQDVIDKTIRINAPSNNTFEKFIKLLEEME